MFKILVINPGSTTTKVAVFENDDAVFEDNIAHSAEETEKHETILGELEMRESTILYALMNKGYTPEDFDAVVGRGGILKPIPCGTYRICDRMVDDLREVSTIEGHASNLAGIIAGKLGKRFGKEAFIVDPVIVDEMMDEARFTGMPLVLRKSIWHALNQKASARLAAAEMGKSYDEVNLIVAHLGGGISVGAHQQGRTIDVNDALNGDGPFSPQRAGSVPAADIIRIAFSGQYTYTEMMKMIKGRAGLMAHLDTNDAREVNQRIDKGDEKARRVYRAMAYQVAKQITAMAAPLKGRVDGLVLTGGLTHDDRLVDWILEYCGFLAPVYRYPGENELKALALGALRVLRGEEPALDYAEAVETYAAVIPKPEPETPKDRGGDGNIAYIRILK